MELHRSSKKTNLLTFLVTVKEYIDLVSWTDSSTAQGGQEAECLVRRLVLSESTLKEI